MKNFIFFLNRLLSRGSRLSEPIDREWEEFRQGLKEQFQKLDHMGIGFPIASV